MSSKANREELRNNIRNVVRSLFNKISIKPISKDKNLDMITGKSSFDIFAGKRKPYAKR